MPPSEARRGPTQAARRASRDRGLPLSDLWWAPGGRQPHSEISQQLSLARIGREPGANRDLKRPAGASDSESESGSESNFASTY